MQANALISSAYCPSDLYGVHSPLKPNDASPRPQGRISSRLSLGLWLGGVILHVAAPFVSEYSPFPEQIEHDIAVSSRRQQSISQW